MSKGYDNFGLGKLRKLHDENPISLSGKEIEVFGDPTEYGFVGRKGSGEFILDFKIKGETHYINANSVLPGKYWRFVGKKTSNIIF